MLAEWDRATRSMWDGLHIVKQVLDAGATVKVLDFPSLDLTTPEGRGFLATFSANNRTHARRVPSGHAQGWLGVAAAHSSIAHALLPWSFSPYTLRFC